jgi:hypothetical protein
MFSNRTETEQITTEDASAEYKLVTTVEYNETTEQEENRMSEYIATSDNPQAVTRTGQLIGSVGHLMTTTITVEDLAPNTIIRTTTARVMDGVVVASTSKLG